MKITLPDIIKTITKFTFVEKDDMLFRKDRASTNALEILCYIVVNDCPYLTAPLAKLSGMHRFEIHEISMRLRRKFTQYAGALDVLNQVRKALRLEEVKRNGDIPTSLRMFGFRWTDKEETDMLQAMHVSAMYMAKKCSYGRQPVEPGFVSVQVKPQKTYDSWYKSN